MKKMLRIVLIVALLGVGTASVVPAQSADASCFNARITQFTRSPFSFVEEGGLIRVTLESNCGQTRIVVNGEVYAESRSSYLEILVDSSDFPSDEELEITGYARDQYDRGWNVAVHRSFTVEIRRQSGTRNTPSTPSTPTGSTATVTTCNGQIFHVGQVLRITYEPDERNRLRTQPNLRAPIIDMIEPGETFVLTGNVLYRDGDYEFAEVYFEGNTDYTALEDCQNQVHFAEPNR